MLLLPILPLLHINSVSPSSFGRTLHSNTNLDFGEYFFLCSTVIGLSIQDVVSRGLRALLDFGLCQRHSQQIHPHHSEIQPSKPPRKLLTIRLQYDDIESNPVAAQADPIPEPYNGLVFGRFNARANVSAACALADATFRKTCFSVYTTLLEARKLTSRVKRASASSALSAVITPLVVMNSTTSWLAKPRTSLPNTISPRSSIMTSRARM